MDRRSMSSVKEGQGLSLLYGLYREFVICIGMAKVNAAAIRSGSCVLHEVVVLSICF
jgi:hypothetical protein